VEISKWNSIERESEIIDFGYNWFRNPDGIDQTRCNSYSIGEIVASQMLQGLFSINRCFGVFNECFSNGEVAPWYSDATRIEILVAQKFKLEFSKETRLYSQEDETTYADHHIPVAPLSRVFRTMQYPLKPFLRGKNVFITDWTTYYFARSKPKTLVLFRKSPFRGVVTVRRQSELVKKHGEFPESLNYFNYKDLIEQFIASRGYRWHPDLLSLFIEYIEVKFREIRSQLVEFASLWEELVDFYEPESLSLPADAIPMWVILLQACENRNIVTTCYLDGYPTVSLWPVSRNRDNSNWSAKRVAAYDDSHKSQLLLRGVPSEQIVMSDYPASGYFSSALRSNKKDLDVIVMSYWPNIFSSLSDYRSPPITLEKILKCLSEFDSLRIAVKIRSIEELDYVKEITKLNGVDAKILTGKFYEHINKTRLVVTGVSSAVYECRLNKTDCIVFEPKENGYSDRLITTSKILNLGQFCRTESELINGIRTVLDSHS